MKRALCAALIPFIYGTISMAQTSELESGGKGPEVREAVVATQAGIAKADPPVEPGPKPAPAEKPRPKSVRKAFFLSLAVPGAGEYYVGQKRYTRGFLTSEAMIWSFALFSRYQGSMWRDDYISYAALEAGTNSARRDDLYYQNVYEWPNSIWYNEYQWVEARDLYPDDPAAQAAYVADKLYAGADAWEWQSEEEWNRFRSLRVKSESAYRRVTYAAGAALLNHLLSAVNAARLAKSHNSRYSIKKRMAMDLNVHPTWGGGMAFVLTGRF